MSRHYVWLLIFSQLLLIPVETYCDDLWGVGLTGVFRGRRHHVISDGCSAISQGGRLALQACQRHFLWERWNCPESAFIRWGVKPREPLTREMAYLDALIAVGIAFSVTRNCSIDSICTFTKRQKFTDQGTGLSSRVGDIVEFGERAVDKLFKNGRSRTDIQSYANAHNAKVGKRIFRQTAKKECKCHGMSGTCTVKSCWPRMAPFHVIADKVYEEYSKAIMLDYEGRAGSLKLGNSAGADSKLAHIPSNRLVFLYKSPDYCKLHTSSDWLGTKNRICWSSDSLVKSPKANCRKLCRKCGKKVEQTKKKVSKMCNCRIKGCCNVECDKCIVTVRQRHCQ